ncbi:MAG: nitrilase-related carbon-nitrogen hydrolase [Burkholderiaceae bacterium]
MKAPVLNVAVSQTQSILGDLEANLRSHLEVIRDARAAGVDVLLFPEMSLTGHSAGSDALRLAIDCNHRYVAQIAAASGPMCTVFGIIEEAPAAQFYNSSLAVRDGAVIFVHRKLNLATYGKLEDGKHFAAGNRIATFEIAAGWRAGILICADAWNPALVYLAALQDVTLLMAPISSAVEAVGAEFDNIDGWDINLRFNAMTYGMPVMMANRVGAEGALTFWGGSRILDSFGRTLAIAPGRSEQLVYAQLDFELVRRARYLLPTRRDVNLPLVRRELERLTQGDSSSLRR